MVERRSSLSFTVEAAQGLRVRRKAVRKELQGNKTVELSIFRFVDNTHPAATKFFDDAIVGDGLADESVGAGHSGAILGCGPKTGQQICLASRPSIRNLDPARDNSREHRFTHDSPTGANLRRRYSYARASTGSLRLASQAG